MEEIWRPVVGYEGRYEVSNLGRVYSLISGKLLKPNNVVGYFQVTLMNCKKRKNKLVHRLVAKAFLDNPLNLPEVNHIDENKHNNCVYNLEWCTIEYNNNYGSKNERCSIKQLNDKNKSKPVIQYTKDGIYVNEYPSTKEVKRKLGFDDSNIGKCCQGKYKTAYGFIWKYKKDME